MSAARASFVERADDASGWGLSNLPLGVFGAEGRGRRIGVRIGASVLDLQACVERGVMDRLDPSVRDSLAQPDLNAHMGLGPAAWSAVRAELARLLDASTPDLRDRTDLAALLLPEWSVSLRVPCRIGDYTDFYASLHHATNVGSMFRPDNPLLPNWKHVPIGYHGRASSIIATGTPVHRPLGQTVAQDSGPPSFGPSKLMDYELEMGAIIGVGNDLGVPIPVAKAASHVYGFVIVNDWSARDVQRPEMSTGLGPQKCKHFASSMSAELALADGLLERIEALEAVVEINGRIVARTSTRGMLHRWGETLAALSRDETLLPGELIASGTLPHGTAMENGHWPQAGDRLRLQIDGVGEILHEVLA